MKKFILMLIVAVFAMGNTTATAQTKALLKDIKKTVKQKTKEKWEMIASSSTMEYAFTKYRTYMEEDEDNRIALTGIASAKTTATGREKATSNAITNYATRVAANVKGKVKSITSSSTDGDGNFDEIDKFGEAFQSAVETKIKGYIKEHFTMRRPEKTGGYEYNVFLSIDRKAAAEAAREAAKAAMESFKLQTLSDQVNDFINDAVNVEE